MNCTLSQTSQLNAVISLFLCSFAFAFSCSSPKTPVSEQYCFVKFDSLIHSIDSSQVETENFSIYDSIELRDKSVKAGQEDLDGQGSVFHFDSSGKLGLYAFMKDWPYSSFMIIYDSTGKKQRLQKNEVVHWIFYTPKDSTVKFTFLLCAIDRNYGDITIKSGKFIKEGITLYESNFTKLICANISIDKADLDSTKRIYMTGRWQDKCSQEEQTFIDSTIAL